MNEENLLAGLEIRPEVAALYVRNLLAVDDLLASFIQEANLGIVAAEDLEKSLVSALAYYTGDLNDEAFVAWVREIALPFFYEIVTVDEADSAVRKGLLYMFCEDRDLYPCNPVMFDQFLADHVREFVAKHLRPEHLRGWLDPKRRRAEDPKRQPPTMATRLTGQAKFEAMNIKKNTLKTPLDRTAPAELCPALAADLPLETNFSD